MENNFYLKKPWLLELNRIEDPNPERIYTKPNELRLHRAERLIDFPSSFFNEFKSEISQEDFRLYPDTDMLKNKIANNFDINNNNILLFAGSLVGIKTFMETFCLEDKKVLISKECYPMHFLFPKMQNTAINYINHLIVSDDTVLKMKLDLNSLLENINEEICCICISNPNSPIGDVLSLEQIELILKKAKSHKLPVLIDEAYIEFSNMESCVKLLESYDNLVVSRTFSKAFGAAGLRCGYLMSGESIVNSIKKIMYPHEITHITSKFCCKLLENKEIMNEYTKNIKLEREKIFEICFKNKIKYLNCQLNTIHIKPNNLELIYDYFLNKKVRCKCRTVNNEKYLCISLYVSFSESELFNQLLNYHNS